MTASTPTRRDFLASTSRALVGAALARGRRGRIHHLPPSILQSANSARALMPEATTSLDLQVLASRAIDAAKSAGASFADIRLGESFRLNISKSNPIFDIVEMYLASQFNYGIRVLVDGAWAFSHGCFPDGDRIAMAASDTVKTARSYAGLVTTKAELVSASPAMGNWTTPIQYDPFEIPLQDQIDQLIALTHVGDRIITGRTIGAFDWVKEQRVFASTEGAMATQTLYRSQAGISAAAQRTYFGDGSFSLHHLSAPRAAGYEIALAPDFPDQLKAATEAGLRLSQLPPRRFDVGRFPVVVDGLILANLLGQTVGRALEMDRALGYENDAGGGSFLSPPAKILGNTMVNPLLNVTANRTRPQAEYVKWDDEGVEPEPYTVLKDGVVMDYHTTRQSALALGDWYHQQGNPVRSHGCAVAEGIGDPVSARMPHLTVAPSPHTAPVEDLYKGISRGLLLTQQCWITVDQQLSGGGLFPYQAFAIEHGKIVSRARNVAIEFATLPMWKTLAALGDESTIYDTVYTVTEGMPWQNISSTSSAPAGLFTAMNVTDIGRQV